QLAKVQTAIKSERKKIQKVFGIKAVDLTKRTRELLCQIENKSQRETEVMLAKEFDMDLSIQEKQIFQKNDSVRIEMTISKQQMEILEQAKALLSHQNPEGSWAALFVKLAEKEIQRKE